MRTSIVIPCFNLGRFLPEAIESALAQGADEVVVSDNWSTDDTAEVIRRFPKVRGVRPPEFLDLCRHYRFAAQQATGDWLCILDADNRLRPGFLARCVEVASRHPQLAYVHTGRHDIDEHGRTLARRPGGLWRAGVRAPPWGFAALAHAFAFTISAALFRRSLLLPEMDRAAELGVRVALDMALALGLAAEHPTAFVAEARCDYRFQATSSSRAGQGELWSTLDALRVALALRRRFPARSTPQRFVGVLGGRALFRALELEESLTRLAPDAKDVVDESARSFTPLAPVGGPRERLRGIGRQLVYAARSSLGGGT